MRLNFEGNRFDIVVEANKKSEKREHGSEYYCSHATHYWYEGSGKVVDKETGKESPFLFRTWEAEEIPDRQLEDYIFSSNHASYGTDSHRNPMKKLSLIEYRRSELVDLIATNVLTKISADRESVIPHFHFSQLGHQMLVEKGFAPSEVGQISLPSLV